MRIPEFILRWTVGPDLYKRLDAYHPSEKQMPWAYQTANPEGRPLHDDWFMFKSTPRLHTARRVPLPFKVIDGAFEKRWLNFHTDYPVSPDHETRTSGDGFQVLTDRGGYGLVTYAAFIDGQWRPCFEKYTRAFVIFGTRYRLSWYIGLHQDNHYSDLMGHIEPFAMSFIKET